MAEDKKKEENFCLYADLIHTVQSTNGRQAKLLYFTPM
jgi:hypothetical protein